MTSSKDARSKTAGSGHPRIFLEPPYPGDDRAWLMDDIWTSDPDYEGADRIEYIRADLVAEKDAEIGRLRAENTRLTEDLEFARRQNR